MHVNTFKKVMTCSGVIAVLLLLLVCAIGTRITMAIRLDK
jgi:hypothetical protein